MLRREARRMETEDAGYCPEIAQKTPGVLCIAMGLAAQPSSPACASCDGVQIE